MSLSFAITNSSFVGITKILADELFVAISLDTELLLLFFVGSIINPIPSSPAHTISLIKDEFSPIEFPYKDKIKIWIQTSDFDAVIWTNLPEKLNLENMTKTEKDPDGRINYLQNLKGSESALAEEYIRNTPKQIATKYKTQIIKTLGWE